MLTIEKSEATGTEKKLMDGFQEASLVYCPTKEMPQKFLQLFKSTATRGLFSA